MIMCAQGKQRDTEAKRKKAFTLVPKAILWACVWWTGASWAKGDESGEWRWFSLNEWAQEDKVVECLFKCNGAMSVAHDTSEGQISSFCLSNTHLPLATTYARLTHLPHKQRRKLLYFFFLAFPPLTICLWKCVALPLCLFLLFLFCFRSFMRGKAVVTLNRT